MLRRPLSSSQHSLVCSGPSSTVVASIGGTAVVPCRFLEASPEVSHNFRKLLVVAASSRAPHPPSIDQRIIKDPEGADM